MYVSKATLRSKEEVTNVITDQKARKLAFEFIYATLKKYDGKILNARLCTFMKSESNDELRSSLEKPSYGVPS